MHEIKTSIRHILPSELPTVRDLDGTARPATHQDLLNMGMVPLGDDYYSCVEQHRGDEIVRDAQGRLQRVWQPDGEPLPGAVVTEGDLHERHAKLPPSARARILRSHVYRALDPLENARAMVAARVDARLGAAGPPATALVPGVATSRAAPDRRALELEEAAALAADPTNSVTLVVVPDGDVDWSGDVVRMSGQIPHSWQGER